MYFLITPPTSNMKINYSTMKSLTSYGENYGKYWKLWTLSFYEKKYIVPLWYFTKNHLKYSKVLFTVENKKLLYFLGYKT